MSIPQGYHIKSKKKKGFNILNCLLISVFITAGILGTAFVFIQTWYVKGISTPNSNDATIVTVEITEGLTSSDIGEMLLEEGLIQDKTLWDVYIKLNGIAPNLLADKYSLPKNLSLEQVADTLTRPQEKHIIWVTFPEGIRYTAMGDILKDVESDFTSGFTVEEFLRIAEFPDNTNFANSEVKAFLNKYKLKGLSIEGFLYPNTYALEPDMSSARVIEFLLEEFIRQTEDLDLDNSEMSFYDALRLASIVESESFGDNDRETIAAIFKNRLDQQWKLQSDATVNYATGKKDRRATYEDLEINSPYNTYKFPGLTPTPINNPRIESIKASLNPIETDYMFFIHDEDGTAYYGVTLDDHNNNVSRYLDN